MLPKLYVNLPKLLYMYNVEQFPSILLLFLKKYNFDLRNLNKINVNGVTPLTLAVEQDQFYVVRSLLNLDVNPLIENIYGNTPLKLALDKPFCKALIKQAIKKRTCSTLCCTVDAEYHYGDQHYEVTKILPGGSCSLAVIEVQDQVTCEKYIVKIKTNVGGLEIRNYIFLDKYVDLFVIKNLTVNFLEVKNTYCLVQKIVEGEMITEAFNKYEKIEDKTCIIVGAIKSLCELHRNGYVHNDALPNNCCWDHNAKQAEFVDYDIMRTKADLAKQDWQEAEYLDLKRLIMGDASTNNVLYGLKHYINNVANVIKDFQDTEISPIIKHKLLAGL